MKITKENDNMASYRKKEDENMCVSVGGED